MEQDYNLKKWSKGCPNTGINCRRSSCGIEYVFIPAALGDDQEGSPVAPKNGSYNNAIVYYEATGNVYLYSSDGVPTRVEKNLDSIIAELQRELDDLETGLADETAAREAADAAIEQEIEDLRNEPDVVDIVGTYADLQAYDTSDLGDKDIIRVLVDEMHDNESTYYRWNKTSQTWTYIGAIEGYYTRGQVDALLDEKQDTLTAGANVQISNNVISATDTTYSAGTGLNLNGTEFSVDLTTIAEKSDIPTTAAEVHALPDTTKYGATLTLAIDSSTYVVTATLKDQDGNTLGSTQTIDLPLESVVVSGSYDSQTKEVVLTLQNGSTVRFSVADLVSGLQETLIAGANIQIASDGKTISATDTTYTAGTGLNLTGTQFSIDSTTVATQSDLAAGLAGKQDTLTAGANITIDSNNVISATGGGSGGVSDVQIDGASIVSGGVATIPFAASSSAGVIKVGTAVSTYMGSDNRLSATTRTYEDYTSGSAAMFIGKGTLENVITGKGLVTNTTYPDNGDAGVIKVGASYGTSIASSGHLISSVRAYEAYSTAGAYMFISKGTLENVITGKGLVDQTDLDTKQDVLTAGSNIQINGSTISATDTTYSNFTGTDGTTAGAAGLVPAPAATDAGKFLKADGTWGTAGSAINVVQSTGLSTTDVMSQRAASLMVYKDPSSQNHIAIGNNANVGAVAGSYYTAVGSSSSATGASSLALGNSSIASGIYSVALSGSSATNRGEFAIGLRDPYGYNNSNYRLLTGLYDPQSAHDAATKGYVDSVTPTITLSTTDIGEGAALPANTLYGVYE